MDTKNDHQELPKALVSLIHHVELNKSGWWDRVVERIVLVAIWHKSLTTLEELTQFLGQGLDNRINQTRIETVVEKGDSSWHSGPATERISQSQRRSSSVSRLRNRSD
jgi:hypothetical protein